MICENCGKEIPNDVPFCEGCGTPIENQEVKKNQEILKYVDKNTDYFSEEFGKIRQCQKPKFNWPAFLVSLPYCVYRKQYSIIKTYLLIPIGLSYLTDIIWSIYLFFSKYSMDVMSLYEANFKYVLINGVFSLWLFIAAILIGKRFNRLYYEKLEQVYVEGEDSKKHTGVSVRNVWILILAISIFAGIITAIDVQSKNQIIERVQTEGFDASEGMKENLVIDDKSEY